MSSHFLQSKEWEAFQISLGRKVWRVDGMLLVELPRALGKIYFYCGGCLKFNFKQLGDLARKRNAVFLKFEPMAEDKVLAQELLKAGFVKSKKEIQPQRTIVLDLTQSEEELLNKMHRKMRYNIRLAGKKDLRFKIYDFPPEADPPLAERAEKKVPEDFWKLLQKTSKRDNFYTHSKEYYKRLLDLLLVKLFAIEYQSKIIAANIILFHEARATYLHGASDYEYRNLMAPYLLHWETIKYAKENGFSEYDLWGIDEKKWPGVTRFKRGFGGKEIEYTGSYDYIFDSWWYMLYKIQSFLNSKLKSQISKPQFKTKKF
jgi:lipid II:glycine glycyltransferase (peptidoglycan interpeptide bridge formation enzyme)